MTAPDEIPGLVESCPDLIERIRKGDIDALVELLAVCGAPGATVTGRSEHGVIPVGWAYSDDNGESWHLCATEPSVRKGRRLVVKVYRPAIIDGDPPSDPRLDRVRDRLGDGFEDLDDRSVAAYLAVEDDRAVRGAAAAILRHLRIYGSVRL